MTVDPSKGSTRYGVVTCGKQAPPPMGPDLGPCRLEPGHDEPCRWKALGGYISLSKVEPGDVPPEVQDLVAEIGRMHKSMRRNLRTSGIATVVSCAAAGYLLVDVLQQVFR